MIDTFINNVIGETYPLCMTINRQKKHVSLIFYKNRIVSVGMNHFKTHPQARKLGYQFDEMHSELDAFRKLPKNLRDKKLILVNTRYNQFGQMRMSRPCDTCLSWCKEIFSDIYYTTNDGICRMDL